MSSDSLPSKSDVMSWDSQCLANFLRKRNLTGCDKVVTRFNINGQRFLTMSENDLQKFPKLHAPFISKICQEINKEKKRFFSAIPTIRPSQPVPNYPQAPGDQSHQENQAWDSEEFESEDDYESPDSNGEGEASGGDYESPEEASDSDSYELPPSERDSGPHILPAKSIENCDYIDSHRSRVADRSHPPVPPERPAAASSLPPVERPVVGMHPRDERSPKRVPAPAVDRRTKPGAQDRPRPPPTGASSSLDRATQPLRSAALLPGEPMRIPKPSLPPSGVRRSASSVMPGFCQNSRQLDQRSEFPEDTVRQNSNTFPLHSRNPSPRLAGTHGQSYQRDSVSPSRSLPAKLQDAMSAHRNSVRPPAVPQTDPEGKQDLDPSWYVGQISRGEAERCLRKVNRDGAFLVRDSSNRSSHQPYTLVVLYQEKVYNIQIRSRPGGFLLGTGLKSSEIFEGISDIIHQHRHMPLVLIDAKNRESGQQNQCTLMYPAGY